MEGLDEWEVLSETGFLGIHHDDVDDDDGGKFASLSDSVFKNYFRCPSPTHQSPPPLPIEYDEDAEVEKKIVTAGDHPLIIHPASVVDHQDPNLELLMISSPKKQQVFFIKKETVTEFVDMKLDLESPKSNNKQLMSRPSSPMAPHQFQQAPAGESEGPQDAEMTMVIDDDDDDAKKQSNWDEEDQKNQGGGGGGGNMNNILKWSLTGIGAICSFGVATVCIFVMGGLVKNSHSGDHHHQKKLQFHIYAEDKRLKEAVSAVRGIPLNRARITSGGYCAAAH